MYMVKLGKILIIIIGAILIMPGGALAEVLTSPSFRLDPNVANTFGGTTTSANYKLVDSGGEAVVGAGSSGSYKLTQGYVAQLEQSIQLTLDAGTLNIPAVTAGESQNAALQATVLTDAPGYDLAINQNNDLTHTDAATTISAIAASISSPALWGEGTTTGLGFTVTAGTNVDSKWGANPNYKYASIPNTAVAFHGKSGFSGGSADITTTQFRLDAPSNKKAGSYTNVVTYTATLVP